MESFLPWGELQRVACFATPGKPFSLSGPQFSHLSKKGFELGQQFPHFGVDRITWRACANPDCWASPPGFMIQSVWAGAKGFALLVSLRVMLLLVVVQGPTLRTISQMVAQVSSSLMLGLPGFGPPSCRYVSLAGSTLPVRLLVT